MKILALGSNLKYQDNLPIDNIEKAYQQLENEGIEILKKSFFYESEAYPNNKDPKFINSAIIIETNLSAQVLLQKIFKIEKKFGRVRNQKNSPRTLDIDILDYDGQIINIKDKNINLDIPHKEIHNRLFVLLPIRDLSVGWLHPESKATIEDMIANFSQDQINKVKKII
jgi:2-amino-4-hydroxy-6-hydroxymethyldihydropteridine diphosphokinase